jgi:cytochrome oxidase assembly protein ShyY1
MKRSKFQQLLTLLLVLSLSALFIALGLWQLDRAQAMKRPVIVDQKIYSLLDLVPVTGALPGAAVNKTVTANGHYVSQFRARNQIDKTNIVRDVSAGIFSIDGCKCAILVARAMWGEAFPSSSTSIKMVGKLLPSQSDDRSSGGTQELSRLDSALLVSQSSLQLLPGFIAVTDESSNGEKITAERIHFPVAIPRVAGFYWQHLSYVVIWWLMAILILALPLYTRRTRAKTMEAEQQ